MTSGAVKRESSFELIRVIAQYMIVMYHLLLVIIYPHTNLPFYKAMFLPLHIGVPLFVFISGYFGIKSDMKRLIKLIGMIFILQVPLLVVYTARGEGGVMDYIKIILFVSNTPFWFVRTYLFLFLFAPVLNYFLKDCSSQSRVMLLIVLCFISHYVGTWGFDPSLVGGKNLVTFMFFYVVGDTLHKYKDYWMNISRWSLITFYLVYNIALVVIYTSFLGHRIADFTFSSIFFVYSSFGLLLNSLLFFMIIGGLKFQSNLINRIGKSSLAIYMLHGSPIIIYSFMPTLVIGLYDYVGGNTAMMMGLLIVLTGLILIASYLLYEILMPIWKLIGKFGDWGQKKYDVVMARFFAPSR